MRAVVFGIVAVVAAACGASCGQSYAFSEWECTADTMVEREPAPACLGFDEHGNCTFWLNGEPYQERVCVTMRRKGVR